VLPMIFWLWHGRKNMFSQKLSVSKILFPVQNKTGPKHQNNRHLWAWPQGAGEITELGSGQKNDEDVAIGLALGRFWGARVRRVTFRDTEQS